MTKQEAIQALAEGKKLTHSYFTSDEWIEQKPNGDYLLEDGVSCSPSEFWAHRKGEHWNEGWEIFVQVIL